MKKIYSLLLLKRRVEKVWGTIVWIKKPCSQQLLQGQKSPLEMKWATHILLVNCCVIKFFWVVMKFLIFGELDISFLFFLKNLLLDTGVNWIWRKRTVEIHFNETFQIHEDDWFQISNPIYRLSISFDILQFPVFVETSFITQSESIVFMPEYLHLGHCALGNQGLTTTLHVVCDISIKISIPNL